MARLNTVTKGRGPASPLKAVADSTVRTYGGGPGAVSDSKSEAFRLGVNLMGGGEGTFYEKGDFRDKRFAGLMEMLAVKDPSWTFSFLRWLRQEGNVRTASIIGAAHAVHARLKDSKSVQEDEILSSLGYIGINRSLVSEVCQRADEPGEFVAYWTKTFGALPKAVKRGLADAAKRLYNEYSYMKYDSESKAVRFADVLNLTHVKADRTSNQVDLFHYIIAKRYGNEIQGDLDLPMITANKLLRADAADDPKALLNAGRLKRAGMTWEDVLSLAGSKLPKDLVWESIVPNMGIFALARNIRNLEQAGVSKDTINFVYSKMRDPEVIAKSRMFPFRWLSVYENCNSLHSKAAAEDALNYATKNIPSLNGDTLVIVDISGSMQHKVSDHSTQSMAGIGALYAAALAEKNPGTVTLVAFADSSRVVPFRKGESILTIAERVTKMCGIIGYGTQTAHAIRNHFVKGKHKRVIVITDGQSFYNGYYGASDLGSLVPADVHMYAFNLAGYKVTDMAAGENRRHQLAGLTDHTFRMIPLLEAGSEASWPWESRD